MHKRNKKRSPIYWLILENTLDKSRIELEEDINPIYLIHHQNTHSLGPTNFCANQGCLIRRRILVNYVKKSVSQEKFNLSRMKRIIKVITTLSFFNDSQLRRRPQKKISCQTSSLYTIILMYTRNKS